MMVRPSLPPLARGIAIGVVAAAALAGLALLLNRDSQVRLNGSVLKVRTVSTDDNASIAVVDVRLENPARALFLVKEVSMSLTTAGGQTVEGVMVAQMDLDRVLAYYPLAGPRFNPTLKERDKLRQGEKFDRTAAASFPVAEKELQGRRSLVIRVLDADGAVAEIAEAQAR